MLDALTLSKCLTSAKYTTTKEAIGAYEKEMFARASIVAQESLDNGELMHSKQALTTMLEFFNCH